MEVDGLVKLPDRKRSVLFVGLETANVFGVRVIVFRPVTWLTRLLVALDCVVLFSDELCCGVDEDCRGIVDFFFIGLSSRSDLPAISPAFRF